MSSQFSSDLPTGAYVIRNCMTSTVVHTQYPEASHTKTSVHAFQRDESTFKDQQIWWIEPVPNRDAESEGGLVYSITSPGTGKALDGNPETAWSGADTYRGDPWQLWRMREVPDSASGEKSYTIVNYFTNGVLDLNGVSPGADAWITVMQYASWRKHNRWEFEIPVIGFPPGWFFVENVSSTDLLSQEYAHSPPTLQAPPSGDVAPQYRSQWQFQWTLSHSRCHTSAAKGEPNSWYIINRLTRLPLSPHCGTMALKDFATRDTVLAWKLELDRNCNWKITNRATSYVLAALGTAVTCNKDNFALSAGCQTWILRPPPQLVQARELPPPYAG